MEGKYNRYLYRYSSLEFDGVHLASQNQKPEWFIRYQSNPHTKEEEKGPPNSTNSTNQPTKRQTQL